MDTCTVQAALVHIKEYDALLLPNGTWQRVQAENLEIFLAAELTGEQFYDWNGPSENNWMGRFETEDMLDAAEQFGDLIAIYDMGDLIVTDGVLLTQLKEVHFNEILAN